MTQTLLVGQEIIAYHRDKWKPGVLVQMGRKWAIVKLNRHANNSKVPCDAVRASATAPAADSCAPSQPTPASQNSDEYRLVIDDGWAKIKRGDRTVCFLPKAYHDETEAILQALQNFNKKPATEKPSEDGWESLEGEHK